MHDRRWIIVEVLDKNVGKQQSVPINLMGVRPAETFDAVIRSFNTVVSHTTQREEHHDGRSNAEFALEIEVTGQCPQNLSLTINCGKHFLTVQQRTVHSLNCARSEQLRITQAISACC